MTSGFDLSQFVKIATVDYPHIVKAIIFFVVGYCLLRIFKILLRRGLKRSDLSEPIRNFIVSFLGIFFLAVLIIATLSTAGIRVTSLLAVLSGVTLAISLAMQGIFTNLFNGLYIFYTKIVEVGQVVEVDGHLGLVTEIGLFYTVVTTFRRERIYVQNTEMCTKKFKNFTANDIVASDFVIKAANTNNIQAVEEAIWEGIKTVNLLVEKKDDPFQHSAVYVTEYAEDLVFRARVWHKASDGYNVFTALPEAVAISFQRNNIVPAQKIGVKIAE